MKTLMVTWFACCVAACAADDRPTAEDRTAEDGTAAVEAAATVAVPWQLPRAPTNAQVEQDPSLESLDPAAPEGILADCVFIQWCDRPPAGPTNGGTICKVRSSCRNQCSNPATLLPECDRDVQAVCGSATAPKIFECF